VSILVIPTPFSGGSSYTMTVPLEGFQFQFEFDYNQRCAEWYMSIADADGVDIYNGMKLMTGFYLMKKCKDPRRPGSGPPQYLPGDFFVISSTADQSPPSLLDLYPGTGRCQLCYITSDWLALIEAGDLSAIQAQVQAGLVNTIPSSYGQP
jgi:uncharacterized protein DUF6983